MLKKQTYCLRLILRQIVTKTLIITIYLLMATTNYQPKLPLQLDSNNNFININDILANVKQKMRMVILTNPGEKLMNPEFGVGAYRYLFENESKNVNIIKNYGVADTVEIIDSKENLKKKLEDK